MAEKKVRISVPAAVGEEVTVRHDGNDPVTFKVNDGHISVPETLERTILANVEGSSTAADTGGGTAKSKG